MAKALPAMLQEIAEVAGEAAALKIAAQYGGKRVYIPARPGPDDHWLTALVGIEAATRLCTHFAVDRRRGAQIEIPLHATGTYRQFLRSLSRQMHELNEAGLSSSEIAGRLGLTQRTVFRHRERHRGGGNDDQGSLF
jgi:hypothetical protein